MILLLTAWGEGMVLLIIGLIALLAWEVLWDWLWTYHLAELNRVDRGYNQIRNTVIDLHKRTQKWL